MQANKKEILIKQIKEAYHLWFTTLTDESQVEFSRVLVTAIPNLLAWNHNILSKTNDTDILKDLIVENLDFMIEIYLYFIVANRGFFNNFLNEHEACFEKAIIYLKMFVFKYLLTLQEKKISAEYLFDRIKNTLTLRTLFGSPVVNSLFGSTENIKQEKPIPKYVEPPKRKKENILFNPRSRAPLSLPILETSQSLPSTPVAGITQIQANIYEKTVKDVSDLKMILEELTKIMNFFKSKNFIKDLIRNDQTVQRHFFSLVTYFRSLLNDDASSQLMDVKNLREVELLLMNQQKKMDSLPERNNKLFTKLFKLYNHSIDLLASNCFETENKLENINVLIKNTIEECDHLPQSLIQQFHMLCDKSQEYNSRIFKTLEKMSSEIFMKKMFENNIMEPLLEQIEIFKTNIINNEFSIFEKNYTFVPLDKIQGNLNEMTKFLKTMINQARNDIKQVSNLQTEILELKISLDKSIENNVLEKAEKKRLEEIIKQQADKIAQLEKECAALKSKHQQIDNLDSFERAQAYFNTAQNKEEKLYKVRIYSKARMVENLDWIMKNCVFKKDETVFKTNILILLKTYDIDLSGLIHIDLESVNEEASKKLIQIFNQLSEDTGSLGVIWLSNFLSKKIKGNDMHDLKSLNKTNDEIFEESLAWFNGKITEEPNTIEEMFVLYQTINLYKKIKYYGKKSIRTFFY
jgi:hypothetical protein